MAFFKTGRDQVKAQTFVTYLERANQLFNPKDYFLTARYLKLAVKKMGPIKRAKAEYLFSQQGWFYVIEVCQALGKKLQQAALSDLVQQCMSIYEWAIKTEDSAAGGGMWSAMISAIDQDPRKIG